MKVLVTASLIQLETEKGGDSFGQEKEQEEGQEERQEEEKEIAGRVVGRKLLDPTTWIYVQHLASERGE